MANRWIVGGFFRGHFDPSLRVKPDTIERVGHAFPLGILGVDGRRVSGFRISFFAPRRRRRVYVEFYFPIVCKPNTLRS